MASKREQVSLLRVALKAIRHEVYEATQTSDRNPNKADLNRIDRLAHQALKDSA